MALHSVLLPMILAVSLATIECCASSPGSSMDLHLHSQKNASGHWIIRVNAQRSIGTEKERELIIDVHEQTRLSANNELEQVVSITTVYPPLHDTSMPGAIEPATTTAMPSTATTSTSTNTSKSCPHSGYQLYPEYNCYKAFSSDGEMKSWSEARQQCIRDGGDLMVIDSEREREDVYIPLYNNVGFYYDPWVGVYIPQGGNNWTTVKGQPALNTWWRPGELHHENVRKCAYADSTGLLGNYYCRFTFPFICEISL